jgi:hypothetical protein
MYLGIMAALRMEGPDPTAEDVNGLRTKGVQDMAASVSESDAQKPFLVAHWPWFSAAAAIFGIASVGLAYLNGASHYWLPTELAMAGVAAYLPFAIAAIYTATFRLGPPFARVLTPTGAQTWVEQQMRPFLESPGLIPLLIIWIGAGCTLILPLGLPGYLPEKALVLAEVILILGLSAVAGWYYLGSLVLLWRAGSTEPNTDLTVSCQGEYRSIHGQYVHIFVQAALLYGLALVAVWLSPGSIAMVRASFRVQLLLVPIAAVAVISFVVIQFLMHRLMANRKHRRLGGLETLLNQHLVSSLRGDKTTADNMQILSVWHDKVSNEPEWPLNFISILTVVVSLLLPLVQVALPFVSPR